MKTSLPDRERCQSIVDLSRKGYTNLEIRKIIYPKGRHNKYHAIVGNILADLEGYDTYVDDVAVERAWMGERAAWESMTHWERAALLNRIQAAYEAGKSHPRYPGARPTGWGTSQGGYGFGVTADCKDGWLTLLSVDLGEHPKRFLRVIDRRKVRDKARARAAAGEA